MSIYSREHMRELHEIMLEQMRKTWPNATLIRLGMRSNMENASQRDPLLQERQKTHGSFEKNAVISQNIKNVFAQYGDYISLTCVQKEALDMIALKMSRILSGQASHKDHWDDIAGYAKLAAEQCTSAS